MTEYWYCKQCGYPIKEAGRLGGFCSDECREVHSEIKKIEMYYAGHENA